MILKEGEPNFLENSRRMTSKFIHQKFLRGHKNNNI